MLNNTTILRSVEVTDRQNNGSLSTDVRDTLGHEFLFLWQQAHGAPQGAVNVTAVQNGLMLLIENAFSQAELALAQQSTDKLLQQYIDSLTHQILPALTNRVEQVLGQQIGATSVTSNIEQNWIMVFVKFGDPTLPDIKP